MKIREGFFLREVAGNHVVVPLGAGALDFNGMINLNETGAFLWKQLETGSTEEKLLEEMLGSYEVTQEDALRDIRRFVEKMREADLLE